ncbi:MAG: (deoxy)nucleoside triphosphate pyrophosphohydrolase [Clostridiales bacterium]|nr:(deoxy)nucleoside triphosphate pyrophosphohydrolase [Clostridiales bacterium]
MKTIRVVAAVILRQNNGKDEIFATQRGYGEFEGGWEFPGGKIESGETPQEALVREIKEELDADISVGDLIVTVEYDYPNFHLSMDCFWCRLQSDHVELNEHEDAKWLSKEELDFVEWLPADVTLVEKISQGRSFGGKKQ